MTPAGLSWSAAWRIARRDLNARFKGLRLLLVCLFLGTGALAAIGTLTGAIEGELANRGQELGGKTLGIIGFGHTGSALAAKLQGFGMRVLAYDKYKSGFSTPWCQESSLQELCDEADFLSLHLPFRHVIDRAGLSDSHCARSP